MRNLCADDVRKDKLVVDGTLDLLIAATGKGTYVNVCKNYTFTPCYFKVQQSKHTFFSSNFDLLY